MREGRGGGKNGVMGGEKEGRGVAYGEGCG